MSNLSEKHAHDPWETCHAHIKNGKWRIDENKQKRTNSGINTCLDNKSSDDFLSNINIISPHISREFLCRMMQTSNLNHNPPAHYFLFMRISGRHYRSRILLMDR